MRGWLLTLLMATVPGMADQVETPATVATGADGGHAICGGDTVAARTPVILTGYGEGGFPIMTTKPAATMSTSTAKSTALTNSPVTSRLS